MDKLRRLLASLSKTELRYLRAFMEALYGKGDDNKSVQVIDLWQSNPVISAEEACKTIYGTPVSAAFKMLVGRICDRVLEIYMLDIVVSKFENPADFEKQVLLRDLTFVYSLRARRLYEDAEELLHRIVRQAAAFDYFDIQSQALIILQSYAHPKVYAALSAQIRETIQKHEVEWRVFALYNEWRHYSSSAVTGISAKDTQVLATLVAQAEELLATCTTVRGQYFCLQMKDTLCQLYDDSAGSQEVLTTLYTLVETYSFLQTRERKGILMRRISELALRQSTFEVAYRRGLEAIPLHAEGSYNAIIAHISLAYSTFFTHRFEEVKQLCHKLIPACTTPKMARWGSVLQYLRACVAFLEGDFSTAHKCLLSCDVLYEEKEGFHAGLRTFEILLLLEEGELDVASSKIESQRKHFERHRPDVREICVNRYLRALERNAFDVRHPTPDMHTLQQQIVATTWYALSHEAIRMEAWIDAKTKGIPYWDAFVVLFPPSAFAPAGTD